MNGFFEGKSVVNVRLEDWMKWASGQSDAVRRVMLPMIQRGSVWKPHKVLDLWDTLLRGMPIGAMMASESSKDEKLVAIVGERNTSMAVTGDIGLIDGQQRTLAMLAGWPQGLINPLRPFAIWLDLMDKAQGEYKFRMWATTRAQPFGYARANAGGQPLGKLDRHKLRFANEIWGKHEDVQTLWAKPEFMPWESVFALPMTELLANKESLLPFIEKRMRDHQEAWMKHEQEWKEKLDNAQEDISSKTKEDIARYFNEKKIADLSVDTKQVASLESCLRNLLDYEFPLIHVRRETFDEDKANSQDSNIDPPLAILFKRIGTGGEPLSNADYVYSVIKHHSSKVHDMVEALLEDKKIRAIFTPTSLVMSAVRLSILALKVEDGKGQKITDSAKIDKATFARLVRNHPEFIELFENTIQRGGWFEASLNKVLDNLSYNSDFREGLPEHALCLIPIPLLETILAWHMLKYPSDGETVTKVTKHHRLCMVRFTLQGNLCILDYDKASELAIKKLQEDNYITKSESFPDQELMKYLCELEKPVAYPLPNPKYLEEIEDVYGFKITDSPSGINGLRGWSRFVSKETADNDHRKHVEIYKRWWNRRRGHIHPMLLWLQRDYVFQAFVEKPALAGMDEETPYDFDHILPSAHWADWRGKGKDKFSDYPLKDGDKVIDDSGYWHIGNSIGNIHVLKSEENRSLGETSASKKLENPDFMKNALIHGDKDFWNKASGSENESRIWKIDRALAFQCAVEQRSFALYTKFYNDLFSGSENGC
ncbi:MAG: DUF262 domain-containing protein [Halothiobacillaceae bacterium]|nr:DUF262 domain-containing protein [Halothiobacillaceae bacterium]